MKSKIVFLLVFLLIVTGCSSTLKMKSSPDGSIETEYLRRGLGTEDPIDVASADAIMRMTKNGEISASSASKEVDCLIGVIVNPWNYTIKVRTSFGGEYKVKAGKYQIAKILLPKENSEVEVYFYSEYYGGDGHRKKLYIDKKIIKNKKGGIIHNGIICDWRYIL
ncbi:MAG: hypothetical protein Athens101410_474 [Parcubacteria group bacterium Athens1014_10]|nr:MAG: hypothetical protein Athens101410_474 [Parcubacteria group bacterium Athens1014_10]TSD05217.1 MAG: hypothetical protein Athens071412_415 [Parcubacteria group bacterium Athens0714_12]